jgi:hypothetical protein
MILRGWLSGSAWALAVGVATAATGTFSRSIPLPLVDHPGNVYIAGETVRIPVPATPKDSLARWRLLDESDEELADGAVSAAAKTIEPGKLQVGWYRCEWLDDAGKLLDWTSAAVVARLRAPTPLDSPIGVDTAMAWFAHDDPPNQRRFANLAALAGVNWLRDRLRWREIEPEPGRFAERTSYDTAASIARAQGLRVLQVFHDTPPWAQEGRPGGEFATDLRHVFRFGRALGRRFAGRVQAWEPWNEANVATFGGHTVDQMCSWQKAAWFGFKTGDPTALVGWNVTTTVPTRQQTEGLMLNETWPYYDTYNIHSYAWAHDFDTLWEAAREACAGRPMWVTECDRGQKHLQNPPWCELSRRDERLKAEYLPQEYAQSLFAGARVHFHFVLGNYYEANGVQFGLLRKDFTPRPAYAALAALGRLLAGARCLGRWEPGRDVHVFAFRARPDGEERDVLVAWAEQKVDWPKRGQTRAPWPGPQDLRVAAAFDYLGRPLPAKPPRELRSAPVFLLLPPGEAGRLSLEPPRTVGRKRMGLPCPVVLQAVFPRDARVKVVDRPWSEGHAYRLQPGKRRMFRLRAYNFADVPVEGLVTVRTDALPAGWRVTPEKWRVRLAPGKMAQLAATFEAATVDGQSPAPDGWCRWRGRFPQVGEAALAIRLKQSDDE